MFYIFNLNDFIIWTNIFDTKAFNFVVRVLNFIHLHILYYLLLVSDKNHLFFHKMFSFH